VDVYHKPVLDKYQDERDFYTDVLCIGSVELIFCNTSNILYKQGFVIVLKHVLVSSVYTEYNMY